MSTQTIHACDGCGHKLVTTWFVVIDASEKQDLCASCFRLRTDDMLLNNKPTQQLSFYTTGKAA